MRLKSLITIVVLLLVFAACGMSQNTHISSTNMKKENVDINIESFKDLFFADQTLEEFASGFQVQTVPAKNDFTHYFALALENTRKGKTDEAAKNLKYVLSMPNIETRVQLWAWKTLRQFGEKPAEIDASEVRGVVIEVPVETGYDTLAVYPDGTLRYINYTGKIAVWDAPDDRFNAQIKNILESAKTFVSKTPVLEKHKPVTPGFVQISILTFKGIYQIEAKAKEINQTSSFYPFLQEGGKIIFGLTEAVQ